MFLLLARNGGSAWGAGGGDYGMRKNKEDGSGGNEKEKGRIADGTKTGSVKVKVKGRDRMLKRRQRCLEFTRKEPEEAPCEDLTGGL